MSRLSALALAGLATITTLVSLAPAEARERYGKRGQGEYVVAESRFGHGTVAGFVRRGPRGTEQVRLPGGTWVDCGRSCSETLRVESVDFWENKGAGMEARTDNACGILGCLSRGLRF